MNDCVTFPGALELRWTKIDWLFIFAVHRDCCCCCFNHVCISLALSLPYTAFVFNCNVSADGIHDCKGFLYLWRCFCDLIRHFWLQRCRCRRCCSSPPLLWFIVVCTATLVCDDGVISYCLLNGPTAVASSRWCCFTLILVICIASIRDVGIDFKNPFLTAAFFFLLLGAPFFCYYYSLLLLIYSIEFHLFHQIASSFLFRNTRLSLFLSDRNSSICSWLPSARDWIVPWLLFLPLANRACPLLPRTVIRSAIPLARGLYLFVPFTCWIISNFPIDTSLSSRTSTRCTQSSFPPYHQP